MVKINHYKIHLSNKRRECKVELNGEPVKGVTSVNISMDVKSCIPQIIFTYTLKEGDTVDVTLDEEVEDITC